MKSLKPVTFPAINFIFEIPWTLKYTQSTAETVRYLEEYKMKGGFR
jgi:hypothetical protein